MRKKNISISTKFSASLTLIIFLVIAISLVTTGIFFQKNCMDNFYESANTSLLEFSDAISMFFNSKEIELNVFAQSDAVKNADEIIHSFLPWGECFVIQSDYFAVREEFFIVSAFRRTSAFSVNV